MVPSKSISRPQGLGCERAVTNLWRLTRFSIVLTLLSCVAPTSWGQAQPQQELTVGIEAAYPPFSIGSTPDSVTGFTVDLWKAVAASEGLRYHFRVLKFPALLQEFKDKKVDILVNLARSQRRHRFADFSVPHLILRGAAFSRADHTPIRVEADLKRVKVIVIKDGLPYDYVTEKKLAGSLVIVKDAHEGFDALQSGLGDVFLISKLTGLITLQELGIANVRALPAQINFTQDYCLAVHEGDKRILEQINEGLAVVKATGEYEKIYDKWLKVYDEATGPQSHLLIYSSMTIALLLLVVVYNLIRRYRENIRSNKAIRSAESMFQATFDQAAVGMSHITLDGYFVRVNDRMCEILGYTKEELYRKTIFDVSYPEDAGRNQELLTKLVSGEIPSYSLEKRYVKKNGVLVWGRVYSAMIKGTSVTYTLGVVEDITESVLARQELEAKEAHYRSFMAFGPSAVLIADGELIVTECNPRACALLGLTSDAIIGRNLLDFHPPFEASRVQEAYSLSQNNGQSEASEVVIRTQSQGEHFVDISSSSFEIAGRKVVKSILHDATARVIAERASQALSAHLDLALEAGGIGVWTFDVDSRELIWDSRMHTLLNVLPSDAPITIADWQSLLQSQNEDLASDLSLEAYRLGVLYVKCLKIAKQPDSSRDIQVWARPEFLGTSKRCFVGVAYDVTERIRVEDNLRSTVDELEAVTKLKDQFIAKISHELRSPLNIILGFSRILLDDTDAPQNKSKIQKIIGSGEHLLSLINDILEIAKDSPSERTLNYEAVELAASIDSVVNLLSPIAAKDHVAIEVMHAAGESEQSPNYVWVDKQLLTQILFNLISNAIKYNREGGSVSIHVYQREDERTVVQVQDSGVGIPKAELSSLFRPFLRLSTGNSCIEGTGLGLSISKQHVQAMGGEISVESIDGVGSAFSFDVATFRGQVDEKLIPQPGANTFAETQSCATKVLVVSGPDEKILEVSDLDMVRHGIQVEYVYTVPDALKIAKWQGTTLIFLSLNLPDGASKDLLQRLKRSAVTRFIPVIAVELDDRAKGEDLEVELMTEEMIRGPIAEEQLEEMVSNYAERTNH